MKIKELEKVLNAKISYLKIGKEYGYVDRVKLTGEEIIIEIRIIAGYQLTAMID